MAQRNLNCSKCGRRSEELLILLCHHHLCINCSAANLKVNMYATMEQRINCEFCGITTELEPSTAAQLERLFYEQTESEISYQQPQQIDKPTVYTKQNKQQTMCREHPDENLNYFCFDCNCECICCECIVHGVHKDHDVANLQKAAPLIQQKIEGQIQDLQIASENIKFHRNRLDKRKKETIDQTQTALDQLKRCFEELRQRLNRKKNEIYSNIQTMLEDQVRAWQYQTEVIQEQADSIRQNNEQIEQVLQSNDPVRLINFYAQKQDEIYNIKVDQNLDRQTSFLYDLNIQDLKASIDNLRGIGLDVSVSKDSDSSFLRGY